MLMFGRQLNLPPGLARGYPPRTPELPSRLDYPVWLQARLRDIHHEVREHAGAVALRQKERYDVRAKRPTFQPGDRVWLYQPQRQSGRTPKLDCWWNGPWTILSLINDVTARIHQPDRPRCRPKTFHVDRLAPYLPER
ncbi:Retrovirus-related Pol polyprotein from transposon 412 [Frankliniella fusca]|nr:Retrovirus-related Pol polyprotein from transposon 412 [Frankliniella fusca]